MTKPTWPSRPIVDSSAFFVVLPRSSIEFISPDHAMYLCSGMLTWDRCLESVGVIRARQIDAKGRRVVDVDVGISPGVDIDVDDKLSPGRKRYVVVKTLSWGNVGLDRCM